MEPSDFEIVLEDNKCNIIYHKETKSFNITNINNYIFSKSLINYNSIFPTLNKKNKKKCTRPIKLDLLNYCIKNKIKFYDMRHVSVIYRGIYLNDINITQKILNDYYQIYNYNTNNTFKDFIKYISFEFNNKLEKYVINSEKMTKEINNNMFKSIPLFVTLLNKENINHMKKYIISLNTNINAYNKVINNIQKKYEIDLLDRHLIKPNEDLSIHITEEKLLLDLSKYPILENNIQNNKDYDNFLENLKFKYELFRKIFYTCLNLNKEINSEITGFLDVVIEIYKSNDRPNLKEYIHKNKYSINNLDMLTKNLSTFNEKINIINNLLNQINIKRKEAHDFTKECINNEKKIKLHNDIMLNLYNFN